jgi:sarcosine oxidase
MSAPYDVIVIGLGAMGSATVFQLARRGLRVLGLEQYDIPHSRGSSHGFSRIIRLAYYEHHAYVPLLFRAYELWRELEMLSGTPLLHVTGSIDAGTSESQIFLGSQQACHIHGVAHEVLTSAELSRRFPAYRLPSDIMAVFQPEGGFLVPELCIVSYIRVAQANGAEIHAREQVLDWLPIGDRVRVRTDREVYEADHLVITAGAWAAKLVPSIVRLAVPERQVLAWLQPSFPDLFAPNKFPVFNLVVEEGRYYGLPIHDVPGFKVGKYHHLFEPIDPDNPDFECRPADEKLLRDFVVRYFPDAAGPTMGLRACMFTNTPDEHFILDLHPEFPQVAIASPCSGHGFKFSSVIGEIMADLAEHGRTSHDISIHRLARFKAKGKKGLGIHFS